MDDVINLCSLLILIHLLLKRLFNLLFCITTPRSMLFTAYFKFFWICIITHGALKPKAAL